MGPVIIPALLVSIVCCFSICISMPAATYFANVNEFAFDHIALLKAMSPFFIILLCGFAIPQLLLSWMLPKEDVLFLKRRFSVTAVQILALTVLILLWLEGSLISNNLPVLDGEGGTYRAIKKLFLSINIWEGGIILSLFFWRKIARNFFTLLFLVLLLYAALIGDSIRGMDEKIPIQNTAPDVLAQLAFHPKNNIIVIMADALPTFAVEEVLGRNEKLRQAIEGFTLFRNNLGSGGYTMHALPSILQGDVYRGGSETRFTYNVFNRADSFVNRFYSQGFNVYVCSLVNRYNAVYTANKVASASTQSIPAIMTPVLYAQLTFRFIPYLFKEKLSQYFTFGHTIKDAKTLQGDADAYVHHFYRGIISRFETLSPLPTAHFLHYIGAHNPFTNNPDGTPLPNDLRWSRDGLIAQSEYVLNNFAYFIDKLRQSDLYKTATIALVADHGDSHRFQKYGSIDSFLTPVFMIKPPHAKGGLTVSDAPVSSVYLPELVDKLDKGGKIEDWVRGLPQERFFINNSRQLCSAVGVTPESLHVRKVEQKDAEATASQFGMLRPGIYYAVGLSSFSKHATDATIKKNIAIDSGYRTYLNGVSELGWRVDTSRPHVSVTLYTSTINWMDAEYPETLTLTFRDLNSDTVIIDQYPVTPGEREITLPNLAVSDQKEIRFSIEPSIHLTPDFERGVLHFNINALSISSSDTP